MDYKNKKNKQRELFENDDVFNAINENEIRFPLYFKNKYNTQYTCYTTREKFEQITISYETESFRGNILFGFNEQLHSYQYDLKLWYYVVSRNQTIIEADEYERIYNQLIMGREEFFKENNSKFEYIEKQPLTQSSIKHKWKQL